MILVGDIGGTKTVLALYRNSSATLDLVREEVFQSGEFPQFDQVLGRFADESVLAQVSTICLGVAGVVKNGQCETTNLPWVLNERTLEKHCHVKRVRLVNDLEAAAYGMLFLKGHEMAVLSEGSGEIRKGNIAVIAAGTGLGEAMLHWNGQSYVAIASEGGHTDFAPQNDREIDLFRFLRSEFGHVSYERLLSGPGLFHDFCILHGKISVGEVTIGLDPDDNRVGVALLGAYDAWGSVDINNGRSTARGFFRSTS